MAKKTQTKAVAKTSAKSLRKATKRAKVRAAPLLAGHAKKTTLARPTSKKPRPTNRRAPADAKALLAMKRDDSLIKQVTAAQTSERPFETIEDIWARTAMPASTGKRHEEPTPSGAVSAALDAKMMEVLPPMVAVTKPFEDMRGMTEASRAGNTAPGTGSPLGAAHRVVDAMPRAARMMFMPLGMMVRQQALAFGFMQDLLQMQRQFLDNLRPLHR